MMNKNVQFSWSSTSALPLVLQYRSIHTPKSANAVVYNVYNQFNKL